MEAIFHHVPVLAAEVIERSDPRAVDGILTARLGAAGMRR